MKYIIQLNRAYHSSSENYNQLAFVSKEDCSLCQFYETLKQWENLVHEKLNEVECDDELFYLWEDLGWELEFINPDFILNINGK